MVQPDSPGSKCYCSLSATERREGGQQGGHNRCLSKCVPASNRAHHIPPGSGAFWCVDPPRTARKTLSPLSFQTPTSSYHCLFALHSAPSFLPSLYKDSSGPRVSRVHCTFAGCLLLHFNLACEGSTSNYSAMLTPCAQSHQNLSRHRLHCFWLTGKQLPPK